VATASDDNTARVWDTRYGGPRTPSLPHSGTVLRAVFSPDGTRLLTAGGGGMAKLWDLPDVGSMALPSPIPATGPTEARSRDGSLRIAADGLTARVYDARTRQTLSPPLTHRGPITCARLSPDGTRAVTTSGDRTARIWDWRSGTEVGKPLRHGSQVNDAVFSPDGSRVATGADDNTARVWDAATGEPVTPAMPFAGTVHAVRFSPGVPGGAGSGRLVLTIGRGTFARVWDAAAGEAVALTRRDAPWVVAALADPASTRSWDLPTDPRPLAELAALAEWLSGHRIDPTGGLVPLDGTELRQAGSIARQGGREPGPGVRPVAERGRP
jgi:WD40 repeat protein